MLYQPYRPGTDVFGFVSRDPRASQAPVLLIKNDTDVTEAVKQMVARIDPRILVNGAPLSDSVEAILRESRSGTDSRLGARPVCTRPHDSRCRRRVWLCGAAAPPRDRHPHGARCSGRGRGSARAGAPRACPRRGIDRRSRRCRPVVDGAAQPAARVEPAGSRVVLLGRRAAGHLRRRGGLLAGTPYRPNRTRSIRCDSSSAAGRTPRYCCRTARRSCRRRTR